MIFLDKTKTKRCDQKKDRDNTFFLASFLAAALWYSKGDGRAEVKILRDIIYFTSVIHFCITYCATNLLFDRHVISILAPRYVLHEHVCCSQCFVVKFYPIPVRCLKDTPWKVVTDQITFIAIS